QFVTTFLAFSFLPYPPDLGDLHSFPTRRSSDLGSSVLCSTSVGMRMAGRTSRTSIARFIRARSAEAPGLARMNLAIDVRDVLPRSEEHTSELQSLAYLVCRLLLEKKKKKYHI